MITLLDSLSKIKESDSQNIILTISSFADQVGQAWEEVGRLVLSDQLRHATNIVFAGMGGSALPGEILKSLGIGLLKIPLEVVSQDHLPGYVNHNSLVIISSYSGSTAETLSCARQALKTTKKLFVFTTGGELARWSVNHHLTSYQPLPIFNPSCQPRLSLGYSLTCFLALMTRLGYLRLNQRSFGSLQIFLRNQNQHLGPACLTQNNLAKQMAISLSNTLPIFICGPHLTGAVTTLRNMLHETSKTLAFNFEIPELNHHLLEAFSNPEFLLSRLKIVIFTSAFYSRDIKRRFKFTTQVLDKRHLNWLTYDLSAKSPLHEAYHVVQLGGFLAFYLAVINGEDPATVPYVDFFKRKMGDN